MNNYQQSGNSDSFLSILSPSYHIQLLIHIKQAIRRIVVSQRCYNPSFIKSDFPIGWEVSMDRPIEPCVDDHQQTDFKPWWAKAMLPNIFYLEK